MTGGLFFVLVFVGLMITFIILVIHDKIHNQSVQISTLTNLLASYKTELAEAKAQHVAPKRIDSSIKVNYRNSFDYDLQLRTEQLENANQKLETVQRTLDSLQSDYHTLSTSHKNCSEKLQKAQIEILSLQSKLAQQETSQFSTSSKVEVADRDFLLHELGEKNKRISQLLSEIAPLHHEINMLKQKSNANDDFERQLDYLRSMFPIIDEILESRPSYSSTISGQDPVREYLSTKEWNELSESQRNQRALDNYIKSHKKTPWQVGRDYELYVAHKYSQQGYDVDPCGSYLKLEDMGRDLILKKDDQIRIVQCKYWSASKTINERFIFLLHGSVISYCIENNLSPDFVKGIFVTNIALSPMAKKCAAFLGINILEKYPLGDFPRIKCNVKKDPNGEYIYIYHLPMDPQYDRVKIKDERECYAYTVEEAESYGFRRAKQ